jgi:cytochrome c-L
MHVFATAGLGATCLATVLLIGLATAPAQGDVEAPEGEPLVFTHALDDEPLDVYTPRDGEEFTEAVEEFHITGENPYDGMDEAIADGQDLFNRTCRACHGVEGAGGMGPALNDDHYRRPRAATDKGTFEIIYGGSAGAMQAFGIRLDQDEILRIMAFIDTLGDAE